MDPTAPLRTSQLGFCCASLALVIALACATGIPSRAAPSTVRKPADAYFDGLHLVGFENPGQWRIENGAITIPAGTRSARVTSIQEYDDVQLHVEWQPPNPPLRSNSGNSGVYFGPYELQILDSYRQKARAPNAMVGSIYGQYAPYVNASLPPDRWTTFCVLFRNARFDAQGKIIAPARLTAIQNGVFIHHDNVITGELLRRPEGGKTMLYNQYVAHRSNKISFQEHGSVVSFRSIRLAGAPIDRSDPAMAALDLIRLEQAQNDPRRAPYSKMEPEPPVVEPADEGRECPSDGRRLGISDIEGKVYLRGGAIIMDGEATLKGGYENCQMHVEWSGQNGLRLSALGEEVVLPATGGENHTVDIAFSLRSIDGKTWVTITTFAQGEFKQQRRITERRRPFSTKLAATGGPCAISSLWIRELEPASRPAD